VGAEDPVHMARGGVVLIDRAPILVVVLPVMKGGCGLQAFQPVLPPVQIGMHNKAPCGGDHGVEHGQQIRAGATGLGQADQVHRQQRREAAEGHIKTMAPAIDQPVDMRGGVVHSVVTPKLGLVVAEAMAPVATTSVIRTISSRPGQHGAGYAGGAPA
jgi:hypothetical protein